MPNSEIESSSISCPTTVYTTRPAGDDVAACALLMVEAELFIEAFDVLTPHVCVHSDRFVDGFVAEIPG